MTNRDNPTGAKAVGSFNAAKFDLKVNKYITSVSDTTALYVRDLVKTTGTAAVDGTPVCTKAAAGESIRGIVVAIEPLHTEENSVYRKASTERIIHVCDDPYISLEMQTNGTLAVTDIGKYANIVVNGGNDITGLSGTMVDLSSTSTESRQLKIVSLIDRVDNEVGQYGKVLCLIHDHELAHGGSYTQENIWKRTGTLIEPYTAGDNVDLGTGDLTANQLNSDTDIKLGLGVADTVLNIIFDGLTNDGNIAYDPATDIFNMTCSLDLNGTQPVNEFSTDITMGGTTPSDTILPTQAAAKAYTDSVARGLHWQKAVKDQIDFTTAEPGSPTVGDRYINTVTGASSVTTQSVTATYIYEWSGTEWIETVPQEGYALWDEAANLVYVFNDAGVWIPLGGTQSFLHLTDTPAAYAAAGAIYNVNGTTDGVRETAVILAEGTNTFSITKGTASLDIAAASVLDINANLTVESASAINQDLTTDFAPTFTGVTLSSLSVLGGIVQTNGSGDLSTNVTLPDGTLATTQSPLDNSPKLATTAYVDAAVVVENLWDRVPGTPNYLLPNTAADDLGATGARITKGWFTDLESTNMPTVGGTSINANAVLDLTSAEVAQLAKIGTITIEVTQWDILGLANQGIATTNSVTFAQVTVDNLVLNANTLSSTSGNINITPDNATDDIILNGHWSFDGKTLVAISDSDTTLTAYAGKNITIEGVTFDGGVVASITDLTVGSSLNLSGTTFAMTSSSNDYVIDCARVSPGDGNDFIVNGADGINAGAGNDGGNIILSTGTGVAGGVNGEIYLQMAGATKVSITDDALIVDVGQRGNVTTVNAATYDLLVTDYIVHVTYTVTGAVTSLTLPTAQLVSGRTIHIVDAGGNAGVNSITIDTQGAEKIVGQNTLVVSGNYNSVTLYTDGSNWFVH